MMSARQNPDQNVLLLFFNINCSFATLFHWNISLSKISYKVEIGNVVIAMKHDAQFSYLATFCDG